ncbi:MAG: protein kinase [Anaerolineae bacterium]
MTDSVPEKLGKYKIIEEVGRGGFAAVYKAVDTTLNRPVALKVLAPHLLWDPTFVRRFQREAEVAANLDHPNIVTIYEVSQIEGVYFIAMQFLEGRTVGQILEAEGPLLVSGVQAILEQIASALDYAHARGFVHRDIKPSNIIVADDGRATLTDFGLVKAGEGTKLSTTGVVFGTPEYMSPEQAEGKKLDARSDVYSLGVVLFEMLAGRAPFMADTTPAVMYKHVHEPPPLDELPSDLPQGVVALVEKALAKDPAGRFQTMAEMVEALRRAVAEAPVPAEAAPPPPPAVAVEERPAEAAPLRPEPKVAPPPLEPVTVPEEEAVPSWRRVSGWAWTPVLDQAALGASVLLLALFLIRAFRVNRHGVWPMVLTLGMLLAIIGGLAGWLTRKLGGQIRWGLMVGVLGTVGSGMGMTADRIGLAPAALLGTATGAALGGGWGLLTRPKRRRWSGAFAIAACVLLLSGNGYLSFQPRYWWRQVRMLQTQLYPVAILPLLPPGRNPVDSVGFSPDGVTLASGLRDGTARLCRVSDGTLLRTLEGHTSTVCSVAFSPDGATLASGSHDDTVRLWRVSDGSTLRTLEGHTDSVLSVAFSPDGATLASGSYDSTVRLWRVSDGSLLRTLQGHTDEVSSVAFSPDEVTLASGSKNEIRLWWVSDGTLLRTLEGHKSWVTSVAFSPDGETLASGSYDATVRLWRVSDGSLLRTLEGHTGFVQSVAFSPDGETLASGSDDGTVRLWGVATD